MDKIKLIDICNPKQWKTIATSQLLDNGKFPVYGANGIIGYYNEFNHEDTTVLITCRGATCGNVHISIPKSYINGNAMALDNLNEKICLKEYLYYFLNYYDMTKIISGSAQPQITIQGLKKIYVKIYSIEEQKNIIKVLNKIKKVIDLKEKQVTSLDNIIKSQFVEMFGDPNIVKFNEKTELKTIMISANNGMARRGNDSDGSIVLRLMELQRNYIDYSNVNKIKLKDNEKKKYLLAEGDILFARVNGNPDNVGRCAYYKDIGEDVYHNDHIIRVKFDLHKINPIYLCILLNDEYGRKEFKNKIKTSAGQYTISQDGVEKVKIPLPPIELQNKFAEFVKQIDKQKFEIENSLKKMQELYESLMEKYFG